MNKKILFITLLLFSVNAYAALGEIGGKPPLVSINNLEEDSSPPYIDELNNLKTDLVLRITSNNATECRYSTIQGFNPLTQGNLCSLADPSNATCEFGKLLNGDYTYYYACKNSSSTWSSSNSKIDFEVNPSITVFVSIISPLDGNQYYIGKEILFEAEIICANEPCTFRWDSNKDTGWHSTDQNISYNGLSIGDHNISLTVTDFFGGVEKGYTIISINPIPTDVLSISDFQITKLEPADRYAVNSKIRVQAKVNYFLFESINAKAFIIISDPRTGQALYGPEPFYLNFSVPAFEEYDLNIDLGNYGFEERQNYKIEFLVVSNFVESSPEYFVDPMDKYSDYWADGQIYFIPETQIPEQNKANNSGYEIIELGPEVLRDISNLPETNSTIILLIVFAVLILLKK